MNELQQVLILFAIIVIAGLYFFQKRKAKSDAPESDSKGLTASRDERTSASEALNELGEPHIPFSKETEHRLHLDEAEADDVPESQLGLAFGQEFEPPPKSASQTTESASSAMQSTPAPADSEATNETTQRKPRHIVLEVEDMQPVMGLESNGDHPYAADDDYTPSFGIPEDGVSAPNTAAETELKEPQIFAIIVMGTQDFAWPKVNQTLHGVGLVPNSNGIFVKKDSMGNEIIRVANLLEPGSFPLDEPTNNEFTTPGVVLILELPTTVKAPAVMHDMIMMSRKISQRLNARLYDAERHLMKESDFQAMRDAAVAYESRAI
ncbi:MAG: cell division protein ZipA C-terminal FtsZ-binding domain-containing protein [Hydrogenovibrio sp.]